MEQQILIVEDEPKLASVLEDYLHQHGFCCQHLDNGADVLPWIQTHKVDLILLDLMLPGQDGMAVCRELRSFSNVPVIMTTARVEEIDRLLGLELGADDYICKPYSPREVVARVKAVLRRAGEAEKTDKQTASGGFEVDEERYQICFKGNKLDLTPAEFHLLSTFLNRPGRVYSRATLMEHLYEDNRVVTDRTVDSHIKNLRKKIARFEPDWQGIQSIYGVGYKLEI